MSENNCLLMEKKLLPRYRKLFDNNKNNIDGLIKKYNELSVLQVTKDDPIIVLTYIGSLGIGAIALWYVFKCAKKEFNEQLKIWKSINYK